MGQNPYAKHQGYGHNPWQKPVADGDTPETVLAGLVDAVRQRIQAANLLTTEEMDDPTAEVEARVAQLALELIEKHNQGAAQAGLPFLEGDPQVLAKQMVDEVLGWGPLSAYMRDSRVEEIILNNYDHGFVIYAGGDKAPLKGFRSPSFARQFLNRKIEAGHGYGVNNKNPYQDARLPDGSRLFVAIPPVAGTELLVVIRRFRPVAADLDALVGLGSITLAMKNFLDAACQAHRTLVLAGGTGTGKTTFLQALTRSFPADDRVVTIEDTPELQLGHLNDWAPQYVRHEAEGVTEIGMSQLVRNALRMRPTRIILGEARGGEMVDILTACNTGHDGTLFTVHANSVHETVDRMVTMYRMGRDLDPGEVRKEIVSAIHYVVHLKRSRGGKRYVAGIGEVRRVEGQAIVVEPLFVSETEGEPARAKEMPSGPARALLEERVPGFNYQRDVIAVEGGSGSFTTGGGAAFTTGGRPDTSQANSYGGGQWTTSR